MVFQTIDKRAVGQANPQKTATAVPTPQHRSFGFPLWLSIGFSWFLKEVEHGLEYLQKSPIAIQWHSRAISVHFPALVLGVSTVEVIPLRFLPFQSRAQGTLQVQATQ